MTEFEPIFLDTNILVYARDRAEAVKGSIAQQLSNELMNAGRVIVSVQVLSEFFSAATKKCRPCLTAHEAAARLQAGNLCQTLRIVPVLVPVTGINAKRPTQQEAMLASYGERLAIKRRGRDSNPRYPCGYTGFRDQHNRPLCHLSDAVSCVIATDEGGG